MDGPKVLTTIHTPPKVEDYILLAEHQSRTPETFFGGKPVLHHHAVAARALIPASQRRMLPVFRTASNVAEAEAAPPSGGANGVHVREEEEEVEQEVDVFVGSETFIIFSQDAACGVSIPYPLIGIHAVKTLEQGPAAGGDGGGRVQCVYMQLDLQDGGADDETYDTVELTIVPAARRAGTTAEGEEETTTSAATRQPQSEAAALFAAISACADLHPDPNPDGSDRGGYDDDDDDRIVFEGALEAAEGFDPAAGVLRGAVDGGLPPPMPGSSGWITADNVHEYFDEGGNWIGEGGGEGEGEGVSGELGEGAGRVRGRDEAEAAGEGGADGGGVNGHQGGGDDVENKRPRIE